MTGSEESTTVVIYLCPNGGLMKNAALPPIGTNNDIDYHYQVGVNTGLSSSPPKDKMAIVSHSDLKSRSYGSKRTVGR